MNFSYNFKPPQKLLEFFTSQKVVKFFGLLFMTIGFLMAAMAIKILIDEKDALTWTPHVALIQSARIRTHINDDGFKSYSVDVIYQYKWENVLYEGNQYRLHDNASSGFEENNKIVQDLRNVAKQKESYPIYVNPNKPSISAIKNTVNSETKLVSIIFGVLFPIIGFVAFFFPHLFNHRVIRSIRR